MNNYSFTHNGKTYRRVSKKKAETLILQNKTVICAPSNLRPFGGWGIGDTIDKILLIAHYSDNTDVKIDRVLIHYCFTKYCNSFSYFNCNNKTGRYINFYVAE